jgi:hypothetical protein
MTGNAANSNHFIHSIPPRLRENFSELELYINSSLILKQLFSCVVSEQINEQYEFIIKKGTGPFYSTFRKQKRGIEKGIGYFLNIKDSILLSLV